MGYSSERGAAARNLLRARAHGHEDAIADAEALAHKWLGSDDDGDEVEEYIASRYADFVPEAPVITDDMVDRAAREIYGPDRWDSDIFFVRSPNSYWPRLVQGIYDARDKARAALEAALAPPA